MWQDNQVRFDMQLAQVKLRVGETLVDSFDFVEDAKGNAGERGKYMITNLRIIWHSIAYPRVNLSIGYNTFITATTKTTNTVNEENGQFLHILTTYGSCKYEFIFKNKESKNTRLYTSTIGVYRAYISSKIYREIKLRSGIVHDKGLIILPSEKVYNTVQGVWNLSTQQGNVGNFIITNIRIVWFADVNSSFNVSLPYITVDKVKVSNSKFGPSLVLVSTDSSGAYVLGFRVDPPEKLYTLKKEIDSLYAAYQRDPIFGVEYSFEHRAVEPVEFKEQAISEFEEANSEISNVLGMYFTETGGDQRRPDSRNHLGIAVEVAREGTSLQSLWELVPAT